ncbi:unnamed protein product [Bathycoccus prasinos]
MTTIEAPEALTEQFLHLSLLEEILPDETTLSEDQSVAISNILAGKNCYVYGPGGTGKTVLLKTAVQKLREEQKKNVAVCATTGIASESIDGVTIHSLSGCGVVEKIHFLGKGLTPARKEVIQEYDVLFIDEISMLSGEMFDRLSEHFGIIREDTTKPFGGLQVVVFGDFLQLQPIPKLSYNSRLKAVCPAMMLDRGLCFQSFTWDMLEFTFCELKKVFRQEDEKFASLLSRVRRGEQRAGKEIVEYVKSQRNIGSDDIRQFEMKLFSKNKDVNAFNTLKLNELKTEAQIYKAIDSEEPCVDISDNRYNDYCKSLKGNWRHLKEIRAEEIVELKVGCEVMMLLNTSVPGTTASDGKPRRLANGSRGKIIKFDIPDEEAMKSHVEKLEKEPDANKRDIDLLNRQLDWVKRAAQKKQKIPFVLFKGFEEAIPILPMEFSFDTSGLGKNVRLQIPIKLAFAITVHKSQGMSLDSCSVDASNVFAPAQVYVALSRCRSAAGLQIENLNSSKIKAPQDALDFYDHLRDPNKYLPNTHKWWQSSPMMNMKEKAANKILRQYYDPIKDKNENGCFSEFLSVKYDRMGKLAGDELLKEEPDANWKCLACNHKRQWSLECCFRAREQVAIDFDANVFVPLGWQRRNSSIHTPESTEPPSSLPSSDCDDEDLQEKTPCPECPKSGGPEACPKCSPLNFCFLPAHGNSSDDQRVRGEQVRTFAFGARKAPKGQLPEREPNMGLDPENAQAKKKALERVLGEIDSTFGKGSIMKLGSAGQAKVATFPSGAMTLDMALGGGLPRGRIVEIYGPESSGKTTLAMHAMAEMQKLGGTVALIDAEHAFDPDYAKRLGLNVDDLVVCQPETGEMALEVVDTLVRSAAVDLICVDSVAALVPRSEIEGEIGMVQVGAHARLMSQALRKINVNAAKANTTILFLNQLRSKVGVIYGNPEVTTGGNALKYYSSVRLDIRRKEVIKGKAGEDDLGTRVKVKVAKNKVAPPYKVAEFDMMFGRGISSEGCVFDVAESTGVIEKKGSWYSFKGEQLGQGREKSLLAAKEKEGLYEEIVRLTREAIAAKMSLLSGEASISSSMDEDDEDEDMFEEEEEEAMAEGGNVAAR